MQSLFGFGKRFGKLVAEFVEFRTFGREAACDFGNEAVATGLGRLKRLDDVTETEERNRTSKRLVADFGQAVCFVEYDVFVRREQCKIELQVSKEERMVHEHHVGVHGLALGNEGRAMVAMRALFAEARRGAARKLGPKHTIAALAERIAIVDVARFSREHPRDERHERIAFFNRKELLRVHQQFFELAEAKVIVAALQNGRTKFAVINLCNLRNRFGPELFLQSAGRRTDQHAFTRNGLVRCGNQVRKRLARTGRSFEHAEATLVHVAFHDRGEVLLVMARLVVFDDKRNKATFLKELAHAWSPGLGQCFYSGGSREGVLRSRKRFGLRCKKRFVAGAFRNLRKRFE